MTDNYWTRNLRYRQTRRRFLGSAGLTGAGAASLALVGCGDDDDAASPTSAATSVPGSSPTSASQPKQGGTLRWHIAGDPPTLYPYENITFQVQQPSAYHYSRLLRGSTGPDVEPSNFTKLEGDLAQGLPEQPDDLTYVFKFKPEIYFHDKAPMNGRQATTQDFIQTWDFFKSSAINASRFNQIVESIEATDEETITINMKEPNAPFLVVGAGSDQGLWFVPVETINNDQAKTDPVGTGPWMYEGIDTGVRMSWSRHNKWFDGPKPYIEKLEAAMMIDPGRILTALEAGELDRGDLSPDKIPDLEAIEPEGKISLVTNSSIITVMFNFDNQPWQDKRVRQALSMSMDRDAYLDIMDASGTNPWNSFFGPALVPYYLDPQDSDFGANSKYFKHDPAAAKALLMEATGSDTLDMNMVSNVDRYGATAQQMWELVASSLKPNFNAANQYQEYAAYIQSSYFGKLTDTKAVTLGHLFGTVLDPDDIFMSCYWSDSSRHNWSGAPIPELAELNPMFLKQRTLLELEERTDYIHDIQRKMAESLLVIPIINWPTANFIQGWVKDAYHKADYASVMETFHGAYFTDDRLAKG